MERKYTAFVLGHTSLSESRIIVSTFTLEGGRRQGVMRLSKKESRAFLAPLTKISVVAAGKEHQELPRFSQVSILAHCFSFAASYRGLSLVSHWGWLVDKTQPEDHADERVFRLLDHCLSSLTSSEGGGNLYMKNFYFEAWLLHFCGMLPRPREEDPLAGDEDDSGESRLWRSLDRQVLQAAFERKIEDFAGLALQLGSLTQPTKVLGSMWERFLDRSIQTRQQLYQQIK